MRFRSRNSSLLTALCRLRTAFRVLPAAFCLLPTAFCRLTTVFLIALSASTAVQAQSPDPIDTLRVETDVVSVNASIFNRDLRKPTANLQQKDFAIYENGEAQEISFFASAETPFDLVLLLDLSASTSKKIDLIRKSSKRFVDAARPDDRIAIVTFSAEVQVVSKLTADHDELKKNISSIEKPIGGTNFWDALRFVLVHVLGQSRTENRRSAVVVMTDGVDNALPDIPGEGSKATFDELMEIVRGSDSIILPIYLDTEKEAGKAVVFINAYAMARKQLEEIAADGGNAIYRAKDLKDLEKVYPQVIKDLATVYSLGYRPASRQRDGVWHGVQVRLPNHPELVVRSKRGYYAK